MNRLFFSNIGDRIQASLVSTPTNNLEGMIDVFKTVSKMESLDLVVGPPWLFLLMERIMKTPHEFVKVIHKEVKNQVKFNLLANLVTWYLLKDIKWDELAELFKNTRLGFSQGEPLLPYLDRVNKSFPSMKIYDLFGSTEMPVQAVQLSPDIPELSYILYSNIAELADPADVLEATTNGTNKINTIPWYEWKKGMRGELIITRNGERMPLLRYPTGDMVEVLDPAHETQIKLIYDEWVVTLPTVKLLGRSSDIVDFELPDHAGNFFNFKFYNNNINEALMKTGNVKWWELYDVKGSPGKLVFLVIPEKVVDDLESFKTEISKNLLSDLTYLEIMNMAKAFIDGGASGFEQYGRKLDITITKTTAYQRVEEEIQRRVKEGYSYGRIKPKRIYLCKNECEYQNLLAKRLN